MIRSFCFKPLPRQCSARDCTWPQGRVDLPLDRLRSLQMISGTTPVTTLNEQIDGTQFFATKVHGFDPERWGGLGFPSERHLQSALRRLAHCPENMVVHIGTMGSDTEDADRGKILGIARLSDVSVETGLIVEGATWARSLERHGRVRWPNAVPYLEAWRFDDPPSEHALLPRLLPKARALGNSILPITEAEARSVLGLRATRASVLGHRDHLALLQKNAFRRIARNKRATWRPPPPSFGRLIVERQDGPALTYRAELLGDGVRTAFVANGEVRVFKVGWTHDPDARESNLNFGMPDLAQMRWCMDWRYAHATRGDAERMEREILEDLSDFVAPRSGSQEILIAPERAVCAAWQRAVSRRHAP